MEGSISSLYRAEGNTGSLHGSSAGMAGCKELLWFWSMDK